MNQSFLPNINSDLIAQRTYVDKMHQENFDFSLMVAEAFIRGIRDIGYKNTATAIDELIDNSYQAGAENVHVIFGYGGNSTKISRIAIIDDGHGMDPDMIRLAIIWGGTHRHNDRKGFGRYGYGLPSASVSQGRKFEVYSIVEGAPWHKNGIDVDNLSDSVLAASGMVRIPPSTPATLPSWIETYIKTSFKKDLSHGTVVVIEKLDKLTWVTETNLERNLLEHFGVTYRNFLHQMNLVVNNKKVELTDPLFLTPGCRFYDENEIRPEALEPVMIEVKDSETRKVQGIIKIRFAYFPPAFTKSDPSNILSPKNNARFNILKSHRGVIILRNGRQIEVVPPNEWFSLESNDVYWKVEVDFPPTLDEEFSITTSKQTVRLSDRIWDHLDKAGVRKAITEMKNHYDRDSKALKDKKEDAPIRASEQAMQEGEKFKTTRPEPSTEQKARSTKRLEDEINKRADTTGRPKEDIRKEYDLEIQGHPYKILREHLPGAPFYRVEQIGGQKVLYLNTAHRFYSKIYWSADSTPYFRAALETLLFVIGDCELDATEDRHTFYESERFLWSSRLNVVLEQLDKFIDASNQRGAEEPEQASVPVQPSLIPGA